MVVSLAYRWRDAELTASGPQVDRRCTGRKVLVPTRNLEGRQRLRNLGLKVLLLQQRIVSFYSNRLLSSRVGSP